MLAIKSWCNSIEDSALKQVEELALHPALACHVALMPDCHAGKGMPIGGVIAVKNAVIPSAVGVDIGCGMVAVETDIDADFFADMQLRRQLLDNLKLRIPVGEGKSHKQTQEWEGFERSHWINSLDRHNLGTLGGGNHFIELQKSDCNKIWLMIHSGSRNLGHRIESHYFKVATEMNGQMGVELPNEFLPFLPMDRVDGQDYFRDMNFALEYALENRHRMMLQFKEAIQEFVPQVTFIQEVNIHHNYASLEEHFGAQYYIHRKGATSAKNGEIGIIPGSMGTNSYIVKGLGNANSFCSCSHGAGRKMSRTAANSNLVATDCDNAMAGICHDRWSISRRHGKKVLDLSEAPLAYKDIDDVIASELDLITPIVKLSPLAVLKG